MASPPPFKIIVYGVLAIEEQLQTPETAQFMAGLFIGYDTTARWTCSGPTADAAREKMEEFWARERKSHEPRQAPPKGPTASLEAPDPGPAAVEDDGEVI